MNGSTLRRYTLGVLFTLILSSPVVLAQQLPNEELAEADAVRIARLFYSLTGRTPPAEAFLEDDVQALLDSRRSAAELEQAVRWIAANVDGADRATLAAILESHLATALGEEEEVVRPDPPPQEEVLEEAEPAPPAWQPTVTQNQAILAEFYGRTDREVPDPPPQADIDGIYTLAAEGWTLQGVQRLASWVPQNVEGAENLSFGQVCQVALQDNGYVGGPRWDGSLEPGVERVKPTFPEKDEGWVSERDPRAYDGGRARTIASMGALPSSLDRGLQGAWLPDLPMRAAELGTSLSPDSGISAWTAFGQSTGRYGISAELRYAQQVPGSLDLHGVSLDGGPTRQLQPWSTGDGLGGRVALGFRDHPSVGVSAWGLSHPDTRQGGAAASLRFGKDPRQSLLLQLGAAGATLPQDGIPITRQRVQLEISPRLALSEDIDLLIRYRFLAAGGGLVDDDDPIQNDLYSERLQQLVLRVEGQPSERLRWGVRAGWEQGTWALDWEQALDEGGIDVYSYGATDSELDLAGALELAVGTDNWVTLGARGLVQPSLGGELSVSARRLVWSRAWVQAGVRAGSQDLVAGTVSVGVPL